MFPSRAEGTSLLPLSFPTDTCVCADPLCSLSLPSWPLSLRLRSIILPLLLLLVLSASHLSFRPSLPLLPVRSYCSPISFSFRFNFSPIAVFESL
jgi:hypothetical protein